MVGFCAVLRGVGPLSGLLSLQLWTVGVAGTLPATDFAGDWIGTSGAGSSKIGIFLTLVRQGSELTGKLSTSAAPGGFVIERVERHGDDLEFEIEDEQDRTVQYRLHGTDAALNGEAASCDGVSKVKLAPAPSVRSYPAIMGLTSAPVPIHTVQPEYTKEARAALLEGTVELRVWVGPDGRVSPLRIRVLHGLGLGLDEQAIEAVKQWHLTPAYKNGKPVPVPVTIAVNFRLFQ